MQFNYPEILYQQILWIRSKSRQIGGDVRLREKGVQPNNASIGLTDVLGVIQQANYARHVIVKQS